MKDFNKLLSYGKLFTLLNNKEALLASIDDNNRDYALDINVVNFADSDVESPLFVSGNDLETLINSELKAKLVNLYHKHHAIVIVGAQFAVLDKVRQTLGLVTNAARIINQDNQLDRSEGAYLYVLTNSVSGDSFEYVHFREKPTSSSYLQDFIKGVSRDQLSTHLQSVYSPNKKTNSKNADGNYELDKITNAQIISFVLPIESKDLSYSDESKQANNQENSYTTTFSVWSAHSFVDNQDYYYFQQSAIYASSPCYVPEYHKSIGGALSKIEEYYLSQVITNVYLNGDKKRLLLEPKPPTNEIKETLSYNFGWNLGGSVGVALTPAGPVPEVKINGDISVSNSRSVPEVKINGGISVSNSRTIQVDKINVYNKCNDQGATNNAKWQYDLAKTQSEFAFFSYGQVDLIPCSRNGHSSFTPTNEWVLATSDRDNPNLIGNIEVSLTSSRGRLVAPAYTGIDEKNIPFNTTLKFFLTPPPNDPNLPLYNE